MSRLAAWLLLWSIGGAALAAWIAWGPLEGVPHIQDEVVYTWQARVLAGGALTEPSPEPLAAFSYHFLMDVDGRRFGIFPNGWPAALALGWLLGLPQLVNPLLHGLTVWLGGRLAEREAAAGWIAAPLLALSPQLLLQGASRLSHTLVAVLGLIAVSAALQDPGSNGRRRGLALGAAIGGLVLTRPLDALVLCLALAPRLRLASLAPIALALALTGAQNRALTGDWGTFAQSAYFDAGVPPTDAPFWRYAPGCNALGFGEDRGCFPTGGGYGHDPTKAAASAADNAALASRLWLGGWPMLLLLAPALLGRGTSQRKTRRLALTGAGVWAAVAAAYSLYWVPGMALGARFHHLAAPLVIVACAGGARALLSRWPSGRALAALLLVPLVWRLSAALPELPGYWGVDGRFAELVDGWDERPYGPALILVGLAPDAQVRLETPQTTGGGVTTRPGLRRGGWFAASGGEVVFAEFQPGAVDETLAAWPDHAPWLYRMAADPTDDHLLAFPDALRDASLGPPPALPVTPVTLQR